MEQYKQEFIEFMVDSQALKFGEFTLKSGRKSPFFMNAGAYVTGAQLRRSNALFYIKCLSLYGTAGHAFHIVLLETHEQNRDGNGNQYAAGTEFRIMGRQAPFFVLNILKLYDRM